MTEIVIAVIVLLIVGLLIGDDTTTFRTGHEVRRGERA